MYSWTVHSLKRFRIRNKTHITFEMISNDLCELTNFVEVIQIRNNPKKTVRAFDKTCLLHLPSNLVLVVNAETKTVITVCHQTSSFKKRRNPLLIKE